MLIDSTSLLANLRAAKPATVITKTNTVKWLTHPCDQTLVKYSGKPTR